MKNCTFVNLKPLRQNSHAHVKFLTFVTCEERLVYTYFLQMPPWKKRAIFLMGTKNSSCQRTKTERTNHDRKIKSEEKNPVT